MPITLLIRYIHRITALMNHNVTSKRENYTIGNNWPFHNSTFFTRTKTYNSHYHNNPFIPYTSTPLKKLSYILKLRYQSVNFHLKTLNSSFNPLGLKRADASPAFLINCRLKFKNYKN